jgi:hypothetical protein
LQQLLLELLLLLALSVPLLSRRMNLIRNSPAALARKNQVQQSLVTLRTTVLVLMASRYHPRSWLSLVEPLLALLLAVLLLLLPRLVELPDRTMFTVCKWTSVPQQRTNWSFDPVLWFGCFTSMTTDG